MPDRPGVDLPGRSLRTIRSETGVTTENLVRDDGVRQLCERGDERREQGGVSVRREIPVDSCEQLFQCYLQLTWRPDRRRADRLGRGLLLSSDNRSFARAQRSSSSETLT